MRYETLDPDEYRDALIEMGASEEDAKAAVEDLRR